MSTVNTRNTSLDQTVQIFDRFYQYRSSIPAQEYDAVYSYFRSVFNTADQAGNFSTTLFRVAELSNIPAMDLLQQFKGMSLPQITLTFAYYLNTIQSPSTLLGVNTPTMPNYYVAHNIKQ